MAINPEPTNPTFPELDGDPIPHAVRHEAPIQSEQLDFESQPPAGQASEPVPGPEATIARRQLQRYRQRAAEISRTYFAIGIISGLVGLGALAYMLQILFSDRGFSFPLAIISGIFGYMSSGFLVMGFLRRSRVRELDEEKEDLDTRLVAQAAEGRRVEATTDTWNVAQGKLEDYWNRNLSQVASIFWISVTVMILGFAVIVFGIVSGIQNPANRDSAFLSVGAGIITEFIGATFMIIFRSTVRQASDYVGTLARIHSVGMAVQVVNEIKDDTIKDNARAEIATTLIGDSNNNQVSNES